MMINRRYFILGGGALSVAYAVGLLPALFSRSVMAESFAVNYTAEQWRQRLSASQYAVLREEDTEPPYSSPLNEEHRDGQFACAGCQQALFSSHTKFDSHTGWPSFWQPLEQAVAVGRRVPWNQATFWKRCMACLACGLMGRWPSGNLHGVT